MLAVSMFDIAHEYLTANNLILLTEDKKNLLRDIRTLLNNGICSEELINGIKAREIKNLKSSDNFIKKIKIKEHSRNLLITDRFYYHNELRITPPAPTKIIDINNGIIKKEEFKYFLEMRASYNLNNAFEYISSKYSFRRVSEDKARALGSLKFLIKKYDIEFILFMVDTVNDIFSDSGRLVKTLIEIKEYDFQASENFMKKISEIKLNGLDSVVPKDRNKPDEL